MQSANDHTLFINLLILPSLKFAQYIAHSIFAISRPRSLYILKFPIIEYIIMLILLFVNKPHACC